MHDEEDCDPPCEWKLGVDGNMQCQNPGVDCSGVSEMPARNKGLMGALLSVVIVGGVFWLQKKKKPAYQDPLFHNRSNTLVPRHTLPAGRAALRNSFLFEWLGLFGISHRN
ncbi:MAG: hypothetical protein EBZ49_10630 [Proteobacteria bacterium]|nr:hypothetical protein [Pseudomonadota bacterium]